MSNEWLDTFGVRMTRTDGSRRTKHIFYWCIYIGHRWSQHWLACVPNDPNQFFSDRLHSSEHHARRFCLLCSLYRLRAAAECSYVCLSLHVRIEQYAWVLLVYEAVLQQSWTATCADVGIKWGSKKEGTPWTPHVYLSLVYLSVTLCLSNKKRAAAISYSVPLESLS